MNKQYLNMMNNYLKTSPTHSGTSRNIALAMAFTLALALSGCGGGEESRVPAAAPATPTTMAVPPAPHSLVVLPASGTITHGMQLTTDMVGPAGIAISSFADVPGGTFSGTPLNGWGEHARIVGPDAEVIDGYSFPPGTVVLQGVNLSSEVVVNSGWLVLRGSKGSLLLNHPKGSTGGGAALYSELSAFNTVGAKDGRQPALSICHRCYFPHSGLENVYSNNVIITESWIAVDPGNTGDHVDGIQTWGGQSGLSIARNRLQWNGEHNDTQSGLIAMYSDGAQNGSTGYNKILIENNYIVIGKGGGIGLHAPMNVATTNMRVIGNRWSWVDGSDPDYSPAIYRGPKFANYRKNGNCWSDNRWSDGENVNKFLLPDNSTSITDKYNAGC
ncbi:MAG: hypothetical protein V4495_06545 [Pseudomonadota bacterium]